MFDLIPFDRGEKSIFNKIAELEKNFFGTLENSFYNIKSDVIDKGDKYVVESELPGFSKEEINIDINQGTI